MTPELETCLNYCDHGEYEGGTPYLPTLRGLIVNAVNAECAAALAAKEKAYRERNQLVLFLTRCFPSHRCKHPESDASWERGWMNIICAHGSCGQMTWHIHDSELSAFEHLPLEEAHWDGHTTEEKYMRLYRCDMNSPEIAALRHEVDRLQTNECVIAQEGIEGMEPPRGKGVNVLKEEKELRKYLSFLKSITEDGGKSSHKIAMKKIRALVRAVREDAVNEMYNYCSHTGHANDKGSCDDCDQIAAAIRGRK